MADIHMKLTDQNLWKPCFEKISQEVDVLVICGDLTDTGDEDEATVLAEELRALSIPVVGVLGNHDYEKGRHKLIRQILMESQMHILDGEAIVLQDIGFAGVKGFGGGFDRYMLSIFGEDVMKNFVHEAVNESLALDRALSRLEQETPDVPKIALMHYAPIKETIEGEPVEIYPFLGTTHLVEPLNRRQVRAAFHGHAHSGHLQGHTQARVPVYNVAVPVLKKWQDQQPYFVLEL